MPGSSALGVLVLAAAWVAIGRSLGRLRRSPRKPEEVALVIGALGLLVIGLIAPLNIPGWQFFSPRFLTPGIALSLSLFAYEKLERSNQRMAFDIAVPVVILLELSSVRALHRRVIAACGDALAGLDHTITRSYAQFPIIFDANCGLPSAPTQAEVPYLGEILHFSSLFAVLHGGTVAYTFAGPSAVHAFVPRPSFHLPVPPNEEWGLAKDDRRLLDPKTRTAILTSQALAGTAYQNILFFGANETDRELLLERGYVIDFEHGSFINAHFEACPIEIDVELKPSDPPITVFVGVGKAAHWTVAIQPSAGKLVGTAAMKAFCGDLWAHVEWQGSNTQCSNADEHGRIRFRAAQPTTTIGCQRDVVSP